MVWIVYKTTCLVNNKIYIGVHKTNNPDVFDGYIGNGISISNQRNVKFPKFPFHFAVQKFGISNFKRETIAVFDSPEEAFNLEKELVNPAFINLDSNYNMALGGGHSKSTNGRIYKFNLEGDLLDIYECIQEASADTGISESAIATSARLLKARRGFLWSYKNNISISDYYIKRLYRYYVYNSDGSFYREFEKRSDLIRTLHLDSANVSRAIKRKIKVGGYYVSNIKVDHI